MADRKLHDKPIELCFGQWKSPVVLDWVLSREHDERLRQLHRLALEGDLVFLHRFEQRRLGLRRGAIDLVGQDDAGKQRSPAQLDRFVMKLSLGHPSPDDEREILRRRRERRQDEVDIDPVSNAEDLLAMRRAVETVHVEPDVERYMVALVNGTRADRRVAVGASPRGSLALLKLARAWAALDGRDYVLPDDVKLFAEPALAHRLVLRPDLWMKQKAAEEVIASVLQSVPVPVVEGA